MIETPDLIEALAANLRPVRRLRPPLLRALCWLSIAAVVFAALAVTRGMRPDLPQYLANLRFLLAMAGAFLTAILAAVAAFMLALPDRSRSWMLLPAPALLIWLSAIGSQCLTDWVSLGAGGIRLGATAQCFATLVLVSLPLSLAMFLMLRRASPLRPGACVFCGSLAVAATTAAALSLLHPLDATVMILAWNLGAAALVLGAGSVLGRRVAGNSLPEPVPPVR